MNRLLRMITLGAAITTILPVGHTVAQSADPVNGTWELNLAKSSFDPGPAPKSQTRTYESDGQTVKHISNGVNAEGKPTQVAYTASYDGKDYPITGNPVADTISLKRIDNDTVEATLKKDGRVVSTTTRVISKDGKEILFKTNGTNARGEAVKNILVFDKR
ncbi:MAG TPA: hypothetical protein VIH25_02160 [Steroidobacteraceae bacterium]